MHRFQIVSLIVAIIYFSKGSEAFRLSHKYDVIDEPGNNCPTSDRCEYRRSTSSTPKATANDYTCACDLQCSEYNDCCIDAPEYLGRKNQMKCIEVRDLGGVYMIDSCPSEYKGPDSVRQLCHSINLGYQEDPFAAMPVTDMSNGITYKNYYCSMCNGKRDSLAMWAPKLECPLLPLFNNSGKFTKEYILESLELQDAYWGVLVDEAGSPFFCDCEVTPVLPSHLQGKIRRCRPNLVSDCPTSWKDKGVRSLCKSYTGHRFDRQEGYGYKNIHCAICNGVNVTQLSCQSFEEIDIFRSSGKFSFAHLMDLNEGKGQIVGQISLCRKSEVYDYFHRKCREVVCIPGFELRGKKCQPRKFNRRIPASRVFIKKSDLPASVFSVVSTVLKSSERKSTGQEQTQVYNVTAISSGTMRHVATQEQTSMVLNSTSVPAISSEVETTSLGTPQNTREKTETTMTLEDLAATSVEDMVPTKEDIETTESHFNFDYDPEISNLVKKLVVHF